MSNPERSGSGDIRGRRSIDRPGSRSLLPGSQQGRLFEQASLYKNAQQALQGLKEITPETLSQIERLCKQGIDRHDRHSDAYRKGKSAYETLSSHRQGAIVSDKNKPLLAAAYLLKHDASQESWKTIHSNLLRCLHPLTQEQLTTYLNESASSHRTEMPHSSHVIVTKTGSSMESSAHKLRSGDFKLGGKIQQRLDLYADIFNNLQDVKKSN